MPNAGLVNGSRLGRAGMAGACVLLAALAAGCARFVYYETPTALPYAAPLPTATPIVEVPAPSSAAPPLLRIEPAVVELAVGETRPVQVWLDNAERLVSVELHIGFEPVSVRVEDADPGVAGIQIGTGAFPAAGEVQQNEVDGDAGRIAYRVAADSPTSGSGMVAVFTVQAVAEGSSALRFEDVVLLDAEGQPLAEVERVDGMVVIGAGATVPAATAEAAPAPTQTPQPTATPTPSPVPTAIPQAGGIYYTVQRGETLYRIALRYGTTVDAIVAANRLPDADAIRAGQLLLVPVRPPSGSAAYVVQPGDTLFSIARRFGTAVETLAALNGLASPYTIRAGQTLVIAP